MIIGDRVDKIEAEIKERKAHEGLKLNILIKGVREIEGGRLAFEYEYTTLYEGVGTIKISGEMYAEEDDKTRKRLLDNWKNGKKIEKDYMERLLNAINYSATAHATLVARVLNYPPPMLPPRLGLRSRTEEKK